MEDSLNEQGPRCLAVMMPIYNEEATLETMLTHVLQSRFVAQVVAVDNGSTDRSGEIIARFAARDPRVLPMSLWPNRGKGGAIRAAIPCLRTEFAIVQDADMEYDPRDYGRLLEPVIAGRADVVYGVRGFGGHTAYSYWYVVGNRIITLAANLLFNCYIHDIETGYKLLRTTLWRHLNLASRGFDVEPQITGRVLRLGYRIHELPIRYYARTRAQGKKVGWRDGVLAILTLLRLRLMSRRALFGPEIDTYHASRQATLSLYHPLKDVDGQPEHDEAALALSHR